MATWSARLRIICTSCASNACGRRLSTISAPRNRSPERSPWRSLSATTSTDGRYQQSAGLGQQQRLVEGLRRQDGRAVQGCGAKHGGLDLRLVRGGARCPHRGREAGQRNTDQARLGVGDLERAIEGQLSDALDIEGGVDLLHRTLQCVRAGARLARARPAGGHSLSGHSRMRDEPVGRDAFIVRSPQLRRARRPPGRPGPGAGSHGPTGGGCRQTP